MKLRNKKTGEICNLFGISCKGMRTFLQFNDNCGNFKFECDSLAKLNEEWEDYEEPKECEYWYIEADGQILQCHKPKFINHLLDKQKAIGDYFETKEEAEKAVEKLKAWKRLKDKKAKIVGWCYSDDVDLDGGGCKFYGDDIIVGIDSGECDVNDLDLLFGGEE